MLPVWIRIGWRNLWRNRRRTAIELMAVAGAVTISVFFINLGAGSYSQMIENGVKGGSGHIGIYSNGYLEEKEISLCFDPEPALIEARKLDGVRSILPRVHAFGLIRSSRDGRAGALMGINMKDEMIINPVIHKDALFSGRLPESGKRVTEILMGEQLAETLDLKPGNRLVWSCQGVDGGVEDHALKLAGTLKTGLKEMDRSVIIAHVQDAGKLIGAPGKVHEIAMVLDSPDLMKSTGDKLSMSLNENYSSPPGIFPWNEAMPQLAHGILLDQAGNVFMLGLIFIIVAIGTTNTLIMAVMERNKEFGILRALGTPQWMIGKIVFTEAISLAVTGSLLGLIGGSLLSAYTWIYGFDMSKFVGDTDIELGGIKMDPVIYSDWNTPVMGIITITVAVLTLLAALYPAYLAMKIQPAEAMKDH